MITVYTVSRWYGQPIIKQFAEKCTGKTVTFVDGRREGMQNEFRAHFLTIDEAKEYFEKAQADNEARFNYELSILKDRSRVFDEFVAKEIEGMAW